MGPALSNLDPARSMPLTLIVEYGWFSEIYHRLRGAAKRGPVNPEKFNKESKQAWNARLRKRVAGKDFDDLVRDYFDALEQSELKKQAQRGRLERVAARWDAVLERDGAEGMVPAGWPMRWLRGGLFVPKEKPHDDYEHGRSDKGIALGAYTPFPRQSHSGKPYHAEVTPELQELYLDRQKQLPSPTLQRLRRRTGTLYRDTWNDFQLDTRTLPIFKDEVGIVEVEEGGNDDG
jgi:hypothetical protein